MDIEVLPSFMERFDGGKSPPFAERTPSASPQSLELLAKAVTRHLEDLLNSRTHLDPRDLEAYPAFANSVLNYGNRDFCGTDPNAMDDGVIDQMKEAITRFEPR